MPRCLETLRKTTYSPLEIVVVDNNSHDGSPEYLREHHPSVRLIELQENLGYSGAYNSVLPHIESEYVVFLNFDVEVEANWLDQPMALMQAESRLAAVQPKLKAYQNHQKFEYSGGSGGFIDQYGYPFVRGRIFDTIEDDNGQYDDIRSIFWATGAAFLTRKSAFEEAGGLDSDFFLHMEELDLCWRYWLTGWDVKVAPAGTVYHYAGAALSADRYHKMYYNHRNGLIMLLKNYGGVTLLRILPIRIALDWVTVVQSLLGKRPKRSLAVLAAHTYVLIHLCSLLKKRARVQKLRRVPDRQLSRVIFPGSVVWRHFIQHKNTFSEAAGEW